MIHGVWSRDTVGWVIAAALLPTLAVLLLQEGLDAALRVGVALAVVAAWQLVFHVAAGMPMSPTALVSAVAVGVLASGDLALWQWILAVSFGTVLGELVFGGWGRNFVSGAVVMLAFVFISFPDVGHAPAGPALALACLPAAAMLLATGILSWRLLTSAVTALCATALLLGIDVAALPSLGGVAFGLVFLLGDPVAAPSTPAGRILCGALGGALTAILGQSLGGIGAPQAIVFAALLASVFAPLIDHAVIAHWAWRRRARHG